MKEVWNCNKMGHLFDPATRNGEYCINCGTRKKPKMYYVKWEYLEACATNTNVQIGVSVRKKGEFGTAPGGPMIESIANKKAFQMRAFFFRQHGDGAVRVFLERSK